MPRGFRTLPSYDGKVKVEFVKVQFWSGLRFRKWPNCFGLGPITILLHTNSAERVAVSPVFLLGFLGFS